MHVLIDARRINHQLLVDTLYLERPPNVPKVTMRNEPQSIYPKNAKHSISLRIRTEQGTFEMHVLIFDNGNVAFFPAMFTETEVPSRQRRMGVGQENAPPIPLYVPAWVYTLAAQSQEL